MDLLLIGGTKRGADSWGAKKTYSGTVVEEND